MKALICLLVFIKVVIAALPKGIDVSSHQPNINWPQVKANGIEFAYIKATEGTGYKSPQFNSQYTGATKVGLIRANGGGWTGDGITLPGALDMEYNPYDSNKCYGLSQAAMVQWIRDFSNTYKSRTGRPPVIYTSTSWWQLCTGNYNGFGSENPLWVARYASAPGQLPAGWSFYSFWQYSDNASPNPGDADVWNGSSASLKKFARGG
ncbi:uncharacterized protein VTP21DRAFT_7835 [Calcarisporiella thermophila]|uniref:uncharacterized protein n=1 Tax=Calcarisporiella thermophila TaxID=911321 RepID=UPI0037445A36